MAKNRFGLNRHIPSDVALAVRRRCGFGCVICGASIVQYDHITPPFADAQSHDPLGIALLCGSCHDQVTRKYWSRERVAAALAQPHCKASGFSWGEFDFGNNQPSLRFAGVTLSNCPVPIAIEGKPLFRLEGPEELGGPFRLSGDFFDSRGRSVCSIDQNRWQLRSKAWDVQFTGGRIEVKSQKGAYALVLVADPPHGLRVERLEMLVRGRLLIGDGEKLVVRRQYGRAMTLTGCAVDNCPVGISV